jgi:hypothetical protein
MWQCSWATLTTAREVGEGAQLAMIPYYELQARGMRIACESESGASVRIGLLWYGTSSREVVGVVCGPSDLAWPPTSVDCPTPIIAFRQVLRNAGMHGLALFAQAVLAAGRNQILTGLVHDPHFALSQLQSAAIQVWVDVTALEVVTSPSDSLRAISLQLVEGIHSLHVTRD